MNSVFHKKTKVIVFNISERYNIIFDSLTECCKHFLNLYGDYNSFDMRKLKRLIDTGSSWNVIETWIDDKGQNVTKIQEFYFDELV